MSLGHSAEPGRSVRWAIVGGMVFLIGLTVALRKDDIRMRLGSYVRPEHLLAWKGRSWAELSQKTPDSLSGTSSRALLSAKRSGVGGFLQRAFPPYHKIPAREAEDMQARIQTISREISTLEGANLRSEKKIRRLFPDRAYIVVDTRANRLYFREQHRVILDAVASTGSGAVLLGPRGQKWVFNTPKGIFRVQNKAAFPVWVKPDWAFIEESKPIPHARSIERVVEGYLGEYALYIGDEYMIHGTLYTRMLGKSVTHGCIRLNDDDLRVVYGAANIGTRIYIY
ncbi:MAG: L,D-transpeptidase [Candidatus Latescibacterota bacterium]